MIELIIPFAVSIVFVYLLIKCYQKEEVKHITVSIRPIEDYQAQSKIDHSETIKLEYVNVLEALDDEIKDVDEAYHNPNISVSEKTKLSRRRTMLYRQRASITEKISNLDRKIEQEYDKLHN